MLLDYGKTDFSLFKSLSLVLVEVEAVNEDLVALALPGRRYFSRLEQRLGLGDLPGRLVGDLLLEVAVEHAEEIVVGAGHDGGVVAVPAALELVKDAVVLVEAAQL